MRQLRFTGFRKLCEEDADKGDFQKSNMDGVLARDLNIIPGSNDDKMDIINGGNVELKGHKLKQFNKMMGFEDDAATKTLRVVQRNQNGVQIEDVSGSCDGQGLNKGRDGPGTFASRPNAHAPCSPTSGRKWWISAKDWDFVRVPTPAGGGAGGAGGAMGGGMPGGPPPSAGGGAPPAGGGAAPPPPPG